MTKRVAAVSRISIHLRFPSKFRIQDDEMRPEPSHSHHPLVSKSVREEAVHWTNLGEPESFLTVNYEHNSFTIDAD